VSEKKFAQCLVSFQPGDGITFKEKGGEAPGRGSIRKGKKEKKTMLHVPKTVIGQTGRCLLRDSKKRYAIPYRKGVGRPLVPTRGVPKERIPPKSCGVGLSKRAGVIKKEVRKRLGVRQS